MPGIVDQVRKYQGAVGKKNIASQPSKSQVDNAKNTSIGKIRGTIDRGRGTVTPNSGDIRMSVPKNSKPRGSMEGYQYAPAAPIAMNGSGYSNPRAQKARYASRDMSPPKTPDRSVMSTNKSRSNVTDFRPSCGIQQRSSITRLKGVSKRNSL